MSHQVDPITGFKIRNNDPEPSKPKSVREALLEHLSSKPGGLTEEAKLAIDQDFPESASQPFFGYIGGGNSSSGPHTGYYTREQLNDHKFFTENKADIMLALKEHRILED